MHEHSSKQSNWHRMTLTLICYLLAAEMKETRRPLLATMWKAQYWNAIIGTISIESYQRCYQFQRLYFTWWFEHVQLLLLDFLFHASGKREEKVTLSKCNKIQHNISRECETIRLSQSFTMRCRNTITRNKHMVLECMTLYKKTPNATFHDKCHSNCHRFRYYCVLPHSNMLFCIRRWNWFFLSLFCVVDKSKSMICSTCFCH